MELSLFLKEIFFVVVVYQRKPEESPAYNALLATAEEFSTPLSIFIYDNSTKASTFHHSHAFYRHDPSNSGVSKAYNEASFLARKHNKKWLLLLDQDTEFEPVALATYYQNVTANPTIKIFAPRMIDKKGVISPFKFLWGKGIRATYVKNGIHSFNILKIINSSMLIHLDAFEIAGGYDERFPLDLSDVVFSDRLSEFFSNFVLIDYTIRHNLSSDDHAMDLQRDLKRFETFILAIKQYRKVSNKFVSNVLAILPRSIKLSIKHKTSLFFQRGILALIQSA